MNEFIDFEGGQIAAYSQDTAHLQSSLLSQFSMAPCEPDHGATGSSTVHQRRPPDDQAFDVSVVGLKRTLQHFSDITSDLYMPWHQRVIETGM